jgi:hypothetical protein
VPSITNEYIECYGDCGSKIEITLRGIPERAADGLLMSLAETLGWTTRDRKGKTEDKTPEVYCEFCQKRAKRIMEGS